MWLLPNIFVSWLDQGTHGNSSIPQSSKQNSKQQGASFPLGLVGLGVDQGHGVWSLVWGAWGLGLMPVDFRGEQSLVAGRGGACSQRT